MKSVFIGGIPAAGKSTLAKKIAGELGIKHEKIDDWREELKTTNEELERWVDFFWDWGDEKTYWETNSCENHWHNLKKQSDELWKVIKDKITQTKEPTIFEGVNLFPHLMREINLEGVYLMGDSVETIFERNKRDPRWGVTEELQKIEAEHFVNCEGVKYKEEAEKYGYQSFTDIKFAEEILKNLISR